MVGVGVVGSFGGGGAQKIKMKELTSGGKCSAKITNKMNTTEYTPISLVEAWKTIEYPKIPKLGAKSSNSATKTDHQKAKVAGVQLSWAPDILTKILNNVIKASQQGAQLVVLQELPLTPYFCQTQNPLYFHHLPTPTLAKEGGGGRLHEWLEELAVKADVSVAFSYYEKANTNLYNTLTVYMPRGNDCR